MRNNDTEKLTGSLSKGLKILELLSENGELGASALGRLLGIDRSSAFRLCETLEKRGYIVKYPGGKYRLSLKLAKLKTSVLDSVEIKRIARPYLEKLALATDEAAGLCVMNGNEGLLIDKQDSPRHIGATLNVGMAEPLYCTSLGKALFCSFPEEERLALLKAADLEKRTEKTQTDIGALLAEARENEKTGMAYDDEEYCVGMRCVSAQIRDFSGKAVASIGISAPVERMNAENIAKFARIVKSVADEISARLGY